MDPIYELLRPYAARGPFVVYLPGPTRKRAEVAYLYTIRYWNPDVATGCVMLWEVQGGRAIYQIALERDVEGSLRLHCTCADAIYRGEDRPHFCKHMHGLLRRDQGTGSMNNTAVGA